MKLYVATTKNNKGEIDTFPLVGRDDKDIHNILDRAAKEIKKYLSEDEFVNSWSFREVNNVDGYVVTLSETSGEELDNLDKYIKENSGIWDLEDTKEFLMYHKDAIKILLDKL